MNIDIIMVITFGGFILGLLGCIKMKRDSLKGIKHPTARWTNISEWEIGLKITAVGVILWAIGLIIKGNL